MSPALSALLVSAPVFLWFAAGSAAAPAADAGLRTELRALHGNRTSGYYAARSNIVARGGAVLPELRARVADPE